MLSDDELLAQVLAVFIEEQAEQRQTIGSIVLELEQHPQQQSRELLEQLFREAHSLKGGARAAGVPQVEVIAHQMEDLFSAVRDGALQLSPDVCDTIHAALDAIGQLVAHISAGRQADLSPHQALLAQLTQITHQRNGQPDDAESPTEQVAELAEISGMIERGEMTTVRLATETLDQLIREVGDLLASAVRSRQRGQELQTLLTLPERWHRIWRETTPAIKRMLRHSEALAPTVHYLDSWQPTLPQRRNQLKFKDVEQVNTALHTAHEVITQLEERLQLLFSHQREDQLQLASVTERLHDQVRRTRMAPLALILNPLRIQLRELARAANKQVQLRIAGGDAEADRQVLDELREVLLHLLRNAVDHGIEYPEARQTAGKQPEGQITISAMVVGDHLRLEIADDGAGLDIAAIKRRAAELRIRTAEELEQLSAEQLMGLIFEPGFSTRSVVSALSGRGVGLDVVRSQVERMRGQLQVDSTVGTGSRFTLTVPLSLTSGQYLLAQLGTQQERQETTLAALPLESVQQIITVGIEELRSTEGRPMVVYQNRPLPVATLADLLGLGAPLELGAGGRALGLVLGSAERQVVCLVEAVVDTQELVLQRLPAPLGSLPGIAGAAILADGQPVPIVDPVDLLRSSSRSKAVSVRTQTPKAQRRAHIVVVDDSITTRTLEKHVLEGAGYQVSIATNGLEALTLLQQLAENGGCDLLLTDVDMPKLNGFDLTARVRAHQQLSHLPIVLVTSLDRPADRERGLAAGADAYIIKRHFDHQHLLDTIARLIS